MLGFQGECYLNAFIIIYLYLSITNNNKMGNSEDSHTPSDEIK